MQQNWLIRSIAVITLVAFTATTAYAGPGRSVYEITIPEEHGTIAQRFKGSSDAVVIHIQDAHANLDAQVNLARIICALLPELSETGNPFVGIEGAIGGYDLKMLRDFPVQEIKERVGKTFVKDGTFIGSEYASIIAEDDFTLFGLEDRDLFSQNYKAFYAVAKEKERLEGEIQVIEAYLSELKTAVYTARLLGFDTAAAQYEDGEKGLFEFLGMLYQEAEASRVDLVEFMSLMQFKEVFILERGIDYDRLHQEIDFVAEEIMAASSDDEDALRARIHTLYDDYKAQVIAQKEIVLALSGMALKQGLDLGRYTQLSRAREFYSKYALIDFGKLLREVAYVSKLVRVSLAETKEEVLLVELWSKVLTLKQLLALKAVKEDVDQFRQDRMKHSIRFLYKGIQVLAERNGVPLSMAAPRFSVDEILRVVDEFYTYAEKRNEAMVANLLQEMTAQGQQVGVLVAGGFHSEGITEILRKEDISYITITPQINELVEDVAYMDRMMGKIVPVDPIVTSFLQVSAQGIAQLVGTDAVAGIDSATLTALNAMVEAMMADVANWASAKDIEAFQNAYAEKITSDIAERLSQLAQQTAITPEDGFSIVRDIVLGALCPKSEESLFSDSNVDHKVLSREINDQSANDSNSSVEISLFDEKTDEVSVNDQLANDSNSSVEISLFDEKTDEASVNDQSANDSSSSVEISLFDEKIDEASVNDQSANDRNSQVDIDLFSASTAEIPSQNGTTGDLANNVEGVAETLGTKGDVNVQGNNIDIRNTINEGIDSATEGSAQSAIDGVETPVDADAAIDLASNAISGHSQLSNIFDVSSMSAAEIAEAFESAFNMSPAEMLGELQNTFGAEATFEIVDAGSSLISSSAQTLGVSVNGLDFQMGVTHTGVTNIVGANLVTGNINVTTLTQALQGHFGANAQVTMDISSMATADFVNGVGVSVTGSTLATPVTFSVAHSTNAQGVTSCTLTGVDGVSTALSTFTNSAQQTLTGLTAVSGAEVTNAMITITDAGQWTLPSVQVTTANAAQYSMFVTADAGANVTTLAHAQTAGSMFSADAAVSIVEANANSFLIAVEMDGSSMSFQFDMGAMYASVDGAHALNLSQLVGTLQGLFHTAGVTISDVGMVDGAMVVETSIDGMMHTIMGAAQDGVMLDGMVSLGSLDAIATALGSVDSVIQSRAAITHIDDIDGVGSSVGVVSPDGITYTLRAIQGLAGDRTDITVNDIVGLIEDIKAVGFAVDQVTDIAGTRTGMFVTVRDASGVEAVAMMIDGVTMVVESAAVIQELAGKTLSHNTLFEKGRTVARMVRAGMIQYGVGLVGQDVTLIRVTDQLSDAELAHAVGRDGAQMVLTGDAENRVLVMEEGLLDAEQESGINWQTNEGRSGSQVVDELRENPFGYTLMRALSDAQEREMDEALHGALGESAMLMLGEKSVLGHSGVFARILFEVVFSVLDKIVLEENGDTEQAAKEALKEALAEQRAAIDKEHGEDEAAQAMAEFEALFAELETILGLVENVMGDFLSQFLREIKTCKSDEAVRELYGTIENIIAGAREGGNETIIISEEIYQDPWSQAMIQSVMAKYGDELNFIVLDTSDAAEMKKLKGVTGNTYLITTDVQAYEREKQQLVGKGFLKRAITIGNPTAEPGSDELFQYRVAMLYFNVVIASLINPDEMDADAGELIDVSKVFHGVDRSGIEDLKSRFSNIARMRRTVHAAA